MTTNTPNPTSDQTNTQNQMNDLPWQSRTSNKVEPLNSTLPPLGEPVSPSPNVTSTVYPVTTEQPKMEQPIKVDQPIEIVQPVVPVQPSEPITPIQINSPIEVVTPIAAALPIEQEKILQTTPTIANVDVKPVIEPTVEQPIKDMGVIMTPGPAFPTAQVPEKTNELPGQSLDASTPLTGKILPDAKNQFSTQPVDQQKPQTVSDPTSTNKAKVRNILVIVGVLVAGVAALVFGIFIASNAS